MGPDGNPYTPLTIDGSFGFHTCEALQWKVRATVDGDYGPRTSAAVEVHVGAPDGGDSDLYPDTGYNPDTVALQNRINAAWGGSLIAVDGKWGTNTTRGLQTVLNDGTF